MKLDANENLCGPSPKVLRALKNLCSKKINFYPCYGELLEEFSYILSLPNEYFLPTNDCDEAISVIFNTYLEHGDNVVSFAPTFVMPKIYAEACGADFVEVDYTKKWEFDVDKLIWAVSESEAKIIYLTSPNSPTGEVISREDVEKILETYPDKIVVLDNTYINFCAKECDYTMLAKKHDNFFIVKSFSKDFALAGLRLGCVITQQENINNLKKIISPYSVNNLAVLAGIEALRDREHFACVKKEILTCKEILTQKLTELGFKVYKSETNFILCDFGTKADFVYEKLLKNKIVVRKFNDEDLKNCFRITVPNKAGLKKLLDVLQVRDLLVFDLDGVVFDVRNSYRIAIERTYTHFTGKKLEAGEIQAAKNLGGLNCDWDLTKHLLDASNVKVSLEEVIEVFQSHFFNPDLAIQPPQSGCSCAHTPRRSCGLIDEEKLLLKESTLKKLVQTHDLCVFTGRPVAEAFYSLKKYDILKYFNLVVGKEDLPADKQKPCPDGLNLLKEKCTYNKIYYFGDTSDDMKCAKSANTIPIGVLPPQDKSVELMANMLAQGAKKILKDINEIRKVI